MANFVRFWDYMTLTPIAITNEVRDFYAQPSNQTQSLRIRIAATHSGKITKNNGFYLPNKMRDGVRTWTAQYPKPIQVHHQDEVDPVGRVIAAHYIDISNKIRDRWSGLKDSVRPLSDALLDAFIDGRLSLPESIDIADRYFIRDAKITEDPDYEGLGYIELVAEITDRDAIQKILDKRYLTGSVGASTDSAVCSICKQDWASEKGMCEHRPGEIYDGSKCVLIAGDLSYNEWSFVNKPADVHSSVIETNIAGVQDFIKTNRDQIPEVSFIVEEDIKMTFKDAITFLRQQEEFQNVENLEDLTKQALETLTEPTEELLLDAVRSLLKPVEDKVEEVVKDKVEDKTEPAKTAEEFFGEEYTEIVGDDAWGADYAEMLFSLLDGIEGEEERAKVVAEINDAKLSTSKRKSLSASSFCGPDRSFPVPDNSHYTAAKRLLGRYKGPGDKGKILACVERKGKRLGCGGEKKDAVEPTLFTEEYYDQFSDEDITLFFDALNKVMTDREMIVDNTSELEDQVKTLKEELAGLKENTGAQRQLDSAQREIKYLCEDIDNLQTELTNQVAAARDASFFHLYQLSVLKDQKLVEFSTFTDQYKDKSLSDLLTEIKDISSTLDLQKITDTLTSGLTRNPEGTVEDPTVIVDNSNAEQTIILDKETIDKIQERYITIRMTHGQQVADKWLNNIKARGIIPSELPEDQS